MNEVDPKWVENNLEYDLRTTDWMLQKVRLSDEYAQDLYAALCNNEFLKLAVMPILKNETWRCSWRHAGGIIADMKEKGDYMDWYLSDNTPPGIVLEYIEEDLKKLGWIVIKEKDE